MKKISGIFVFILILFCANVYAELLPVPQEPVTKTVDLNKDGKPDIIYYRDGKYVGKVEMDTNYDGKPDKKFSDLKSFNQWLNSTNPDFYKQLNSRDWDLSLIKF